MRREPYITPEEIEAFREKIEIGQTVAVDNGDERWPYWQKWTVIGKGKYFLVCQRKAGLQTFTESVLYVQLIIGDGARIGGEK